jgi:hypothetical protein
MSCTRNPTIYSRTVYWPTLSSDFGLYLYFLIDRIRLLIHIISNVRDERITCDSLRGLAGDIKRMLDDSSRVEIIYEILDVCKERESIKAGKSRQ